MSVERGIWSDEAGGFLELGIYNDEQAVRYVADLVREGENPDQLEVLEFCSEHRDDEQPADGCELCAEDDLQCSDCGNAMEGGPIGFNREASEYICDGCMGERLDE